MFDPLAWQLAFVCFLFGMCWYPCHCQGAPPDAECNICHTDSDTMAVTFSGLTNHTWCSLCAGLNGTYVLSRNLANECAWNYSVSNQSLCQTSWPYSSLTIDASVGESGGTNWWFVTITFTTILQGSARTSSAFYRWNSGSGSQLDCTAEQTLGVHTYTPSPTHPMCDNWGNLTLTVN